MDSANDDDRPAISDEEMLELARRILTLDARWRARLRKCEPDSVRGERIVDQVGLRLLERCRSGQPPRDPARWFDRAVRNLWKSPSKLARRTHDPLDPEAPDLATEVDSSGADETATQESEHDWLLRIAPKLPSHLTSRKQRIIDASIVAQTDYQTAQQAGEQIANFRRARAEVARKIRSLLRNGILPYPSSTLGDSSTDRAHGRVGESQSSPPPPNDARYLRRRRRYRLSAECSPRTEGATCVDYRASCAASRC